MKKFKLICIRILIIIGVIFCFLLLNTLRMVLHYSIHQKDYGKSVSIQGTKNHYIPQGIAYSKKYNVVLQTSYHHNHDVSMLYVIDFKKNKVLKKLQLHLVDGKNNTLHVGGIATDEEFVWITNDYQISTYRLEEIMDAEKDYIDSIQDQELPIRGDFCTYHNNMLWIGEFYLKPFYDVKNGVPLLMGYDLGQDINYAKPKVILSLPKMVQGLTFNEKNEMVFTRSFTYLNLSRLTTYKNVLKQTPESTMKVGNQEIPYYQLTKKEIVDNRNIPPMAEGIFYLDGSYYILFESNAKDYSLAFPKVKNVIQYKIDKK